MALQKKGKGVRDSAPFPEGEAERLVEVLRNHVLAAEDDAPDAVRHLAATEGVMRVIEQQLRPRFERYARGAFPNDEGLQVDAMEEMYFLLRSDLMGASGGDAAFYTSRFNLAVKSIIIDAIRTVRSENERNRTTGKERLPTVPLDAHIGEAVGHDLTLSEVVCDTAELPIAEQVIGRDLFRDLLSRLPTSGHRTVFTLRVAGHTWPEIVEQTGISKRTAELWFQAGRELLKVVMKNYIEEAEL